MPLWPLMGLINIGYKMPHNPQIVDLQRHKPTLNVRGSKRHKHLLKTRNNNYT